MNTAKFILLKVLEDTSFLFAIIFAIKFFLLFAIGNLVGAVIFIAIGWICARSCARIVW